ncbi:phospho-N-acetylmuramoyl-pentapeptide- transferase MraY [Paenibacillus larvae subsp. larvae]|uniref:Phospho-N-acetylmuramoyl-pentapeptide-transferase n=1 Tax=Paenibacillus larvae subsp. larvae TaxID=147375 RepID=A0A2L1UG57_9BACL|nr:phospho-N-acetylmuramoyl-pentapeptide-transferase [Paenibacillus larvae]AQT83863.1 phospho-N-acetylmuramoyl-pentapeptide-transferase [Paenibacillus larvae subsp. pulvifaciens]AQZ45303.1 phospho-N-acetylmuramoyl-pentapeptide-transferase [Paenibacillus larvae subsp. pulvifaciens]AVF27250.1 phospho-N-acetylmuramoyl-pentapeptide- transferase MraY [Paenibacillus larvae subsp. larvae]AVF31913.1 phospho-N-acetylmuramoyl-pentapeptide- transferase MraY [Paenibacillus larvae subsp. larvae]MBH0343255.
MELKVVLLTMGVAFVLALIMGPLFIPILRRMKFGQQVRTEGPKAHLKKQGIPTMGGIIIMLALALASLRFAEFDIQLLILLIATLGYGLIGFLDDYIKIVFKRSLGLTAKQKLAGQLLVSLIVCVLLVKSGYSTEIHIPFADISFNLGWFYFPCMVILMLGASNAVNFTDGLDGLLAGTSAIAFGAYTIIAMNNTQPDVAIFSAAMVGAVLGFLVFNAHPAKVFMGDTGSLGIGGGLVAVAVLTKAELVLAIIGGIFLIEILSVVIQVVSFKTRGKRVFKMSPIHHHFELVGWSEWRVVITFWTVGLVFAALGLIINEVL